MTHWSGSTLVIIFHPSTWGICKRFINVLTQRSLFSTKCQNSPILTHISYYQIPTESLSDAFGCGTVAWCIMSKKQISTIIRQMFDTMHRVTQPVARCHRSKGFWHDTVCQCCSTKPPCSKNRDKFTSGISRSNCSDFIRFASAYVNSEFGS